MKAKFTKGEWITVDGDGLSKEVMITTSERLSNSKGSICEKDIYFEGVHGDEQLANMYLIKIAPKLYNFLEDIVDGALDEADNNELVKLLAEARGE